MKRDTSPKYDLTVSFDSEFNNNLTESLKITEKLQVALKDKTRSLTLTVDGATVESDVNKSKLAEAKESCHAGFSLVKGKCGEWLCILFFSSKRVLTSCFREDKINNGLVSLILQ